MHIKADETIPVAIVGAQGYAGRELARLLLQHPHTQLAGVFSRQAHWQLSDDLPEVNVGQVAHYGVEALGAKAKQFAVVFLATPPQASMEMLPLLAELGVAVIDLSGAFRLAPAEFNDWYGESHTAPEFINKVVYGLAPWWTAQQLKNHSQLIANPGCYATCALMSLLPLLKSGVVQSDNIIIDAKSGVSGAGKKAGSDLLFAEMNNNFYPYKIGTHQHTPEIASTIKLFTDVVTTPTMITQLLPVKRGIAMTVYADATVNFNNDAEILAAIAESYHSAYENYPLVKFAALDKNNPQAAKKLLVLQQVVGSARTHIVFSVQNKKIILFASIDNLLKGAASQALENFNALFNYPLETGLLKLEGIL